MPPVLMHLNCNRRQDDAICSTLHQPHQTHYPQPASHTHLRDCRPRVPTRPCHPRNDAQRAVRHEGHDAKRGPAGRLAEEGEDEHHHDGGRQVVHRAEDETKDSAQRLQQPEVPDAAAHAEAGGRPVGHEPTEGAGEDIHQAKGSCEEGDEKGQRRGGVGGLCEQRTK